MSIRAIGLDLGTTHIKACVYYLSDRAPSLVIKKAPEILVDGERCVSDAMAYIAIIKEVLDEASSAMDASDRKIPLGVCSQRSSFLIWDKYSAKPLTGLISWQDRRAQPWCEQHSNLKKKIAELSGLVLSPHYIAPKLATLIANSPTLADGLEQGNYLWGTIDCYMVYFSSLKHAYILDLTMAARSLMVELQETKWSETLLRDFFDQRIPLPEIRHSCFTPVETRRFEINTLISDQAAAVLNLLKNPEEILINLGTGGFILRLMSSIDDKPDGYLCGPVLHLPEQTLYVLEGTINGLASAVKGIPQGFSGSHSECCHDQFCLPDVNGVGAPHWRPDLSLCFSESKPEQGTDEYYQLICEGIIFRVYEIVQDMNSQPSQIMLSGGLSHIPFLTKGIATILKQAVHLLQQPDASLAGVTRLAANMSPYECLMNETIESTDSLSYLHEKLGEWQKWCQTFLLN